MQYFYVQCRGTEDTNISKLQIKAVFKKSLSTSSYLKEK